MTVVGAVAAEVRAHAARKGMRQREIAALLGLSQAQVSRKMQGFHGFSVDELYALADAFGCSVSDLLPPVDPKMPVTAWQWQWLAALRWYRRAWEASGAEEQGGPIDPDEAVDYLVASWQAVWHLLDYLENDDDVQRRAGQAVREAAMQRPALGNIADLANTAKHAIKTRGRSGHVQPFAYWSVGFYGDDGTWQPSHTGMGLLSSGDDEASRGDAKLGGLGAVYAALLAWRDLLADLGIDTAWSDEADVDKLPHRPEWRARA